MTTSPQRPGYDPRARSRGLIAAAFWSIVCLLAFLWWASTYSSLVERIGEWEFGRFDAYYPTLTVVLGVALLAAPVLLVVLGHRRRLRRQAEEASPPTAAERVAVAINAAERGRLFFLAITAVSALSAFGALLSLLALPATDRPAVTVDRATAAPVGPARFAPGSSIGRVGLLREDVGLAQRVIYVAPVFLGGEAGHEARFFTEVERLASSSATPRFAAIRGGVLQPDGVPRELVNLYRGAGVRVVDRPYLLVGDVARLRWRPLVLAAQLALLALLAGFGSLALRRQARRLRRQVRGRDRAVQA